MAFCSPPRQGEASGLTQVKSWMGRAPVIREAYCELLRLEVICSFDQTLWSEAHCDSISSSGYTVSKERSSCRNLDVNCPGMLNISHSMAIEGL